MQFKRRSLDAEQNLMGSFTLFTKNVRAPMQPLEHFQSKRYS